MADNYLEKKFEQLGGGKTVVLRKSYPSLDTLLHRTRSCRSYDSSYMPARNMLEKIVAVNTLLPSAMNRQALRFRPVTGEEMDAVKPLLHMGAALPGEQIPQPGKEPTACIVVCAGVEEDRWMDIDLGISLHAMALRATELGLASCIVGSCEPAALRQALSLELQPLAVLALGKGDGSIFLKPVEAGESLKYYRKEGVHYVPKLRLEDIILK